MARPSIFSDELVATICDRIADGESLRAICLDKDMPARSTVNKWLAEKDGFSDQYARAKEFQADMLFDEIIDIADNATAETVQAARLQIDARKWMVGKLRPKKYGDKIEHDHSVKRISEIRLVPLEAPVIEHDENERPGETKH